MYPYRVFVSYPNPRPHGFRGLQWEERKAFERHAREVGCDLIIDLDLPYDSAGLYAKRVRLEILLDFLESLPDDKVRGSTLSRTKRT